jgi:hypothetical protein
MPTHQRAAAECGRSPSRTRLGVAAQVCCMTNRLAPNDLEAWRRHLREDHDGEFDTTLAHQIAAKLMVEVELLWDERARMRAEAFVRAATILEGRLTDLGRRGPHQRPRDLSGEVQLTHCVTDVYAQP